MRTLRPFLFSIAVLALGCGPSSSDSSGGGSSGGTPYTPPPQVLMIFSTNPGNGAENVDRDGNIVITFDRGIVNNSVQPSTITFTSAFGSIVGGFTVSGSVVTFNPNQPLPASSPITCTVKTGVTGSGSTHLPQDFQWTFRCGDAPQPIASGTGLEQGRIASSAGGLVLAMWIHDDNGIFRVKARAWQDQPGWGQTVELAAAAAEISHLKVLCTDDNQAVAVWTEGSAAPYTFRTARYGVGAGWGSVQTLAAAGTTSNLYFAMHRDGWGGAGWRTGGDNYGFRYLYADGTWGDEADTGEGVLNYTLCPGSNGELYTSHTILNPVVDYNFYYASRYVPGSGWSDVDVWNGSVGNHYGTAMHPAGMLSYYAQDGDFLIYRFDGTDWNGFETMTSDTGTMSSAHFAAAPDGYSLMAWTFSTLGEPSDIVGAYLAPAGNELTRQTLESLDTEPSAPIVAFKDNGESWVFFSQADAVAESIWRARYVPGSGWVAAEQIDDGDWACSGLRASVSGSAGAALWFRENTSTELVVRILR